MPKQQQKNIASDFFLTDDEVRLVWPALFSPNTKGFDGKPLDRPRFEVCIFIPKRPNANGDSAWDFYAKKITEVMLASLGHENWNAVKTGNKPWPLQDSDHPLFIGSNPWAAGTWYIRCRSFYMPRVVDARNNEITVEAARLAAEPPIKSGDYGRVSLNFWSYDYQGNFGISAGFEGVKLTRRGDPVGGGARTAAAIFGEAEPTGSVAPVDPLPEVPRSFGPGPAAPAGYGLPITGPTQYGPPNGASPPPPPASVIHGGGGAGGPVAPVAYGSGGGPAGPTAFNPVAAPPPPPPPAPPAPPAPVDPRAGWVRSPDGQWILNPSTNQWEAAPLVGTGGAGGYVPLQAPSAGPTMPPGYGPKK